MASTVVHVFQEEEPEMADLHFTFWFGVTRDWGEEDENSEVCWCGARRVDLGPNTVGVWHLYEFTDEAAHDDGWELWGTPWPE